MKPQPDPRPPPQPSPCEGEGWGGGFTVPLAIWVGGGASRWARVCLQSLTRQPEDSHDNHPGDSEGIATLVVASGERAVLLAASEEVLDQVSGVIGIAIEGAGAVFGAELGDGEPDTALPHVCPVLTPRVALVAHEAARSEPWAAGPRTADGAEVEESGEDRRLVLLTRSEHDGQRLAGTVSLEVDLGTETTLTSPRASESGAPPLHQLRAGARG